MFSDGYKTWVVSCPQGYNKYSHSNITLHSHTHTFVLLWAAVSCRPSRRPSASCAALVPAQECLSQWLGCLGHRHRQNPLSFQVLGMQLLGLPKFSQGHAAFGTLHAPGCMRLLPQPSSRRTTPSSLSALTADLPCLRSQSSESSSSVQPPCTDTRYWVAASYGVHAHFLLPAAGISRSSLMKSALTPIRLCSRERRWFGVSRP